MLFLKGLVASFSLIPKPVLLSKMRCLRSLFVELSFATAPKGEVGKGLQHHNKNSKQTVYIVSYPQPEDIKFASKIDNNTYINW